jgi:hypothetical protein
VDINGFKVLLLRDPAYFTMMTPGMKSLKGSKLITN